MNKFILISLSAWMCAVCSMTSAQDFILLDNDTISCKIHSITTNKVKYSLDGETYALDRVLVTRMVIRDSNTVALPRNRIDYARYGYEPLGDDLIEAEDVLPNTFFNGSFGVLQQHGMVGVKGVLGYRNSGILFGGGYWGQLTYTIGAQVSQGNFYLSYCYAPYDMVATSLGMKELEQGHFLFLGRMFNLDAKKIYFVDLSIGLYFGHNNKIPFIQTEAEGITASGGIGFRIPDKWGMDGWFSRKLDSLEEDVDIDLNELTK